MFNYYLKDQLGLTSAYNGIIKAVVGFISFLFNMTLCLWIIRKADTGKSTVVLVAVCTLASLGTVPVASIALILGVDRFMSEARALTNLVGNGVATVVVAKWVKELDAKQMDDVLNNRVPANKTHELSS